MTGRSKRICPNCSKEVQGRIDKVFCTPYCKSNFHYEKNRDNKDNLYREIDIQLKLNRRILKNFNKAGKAVIRSEKMHTEGFNPNFFTHYWKNKKGDVYLFCYEYGFISIQEKNISKYVLIQWQTYMKKKAKLI